MTSNQTDIVPADKVQYLPTDWWLDNAFLQRTVKPLHILVDCGYVDYKAARENADKVLRVIGKRNLCLVAFNRVLIHIPPTKLAQVLRRFREITPGAGYSWTTHVFDRGGAQFALP